MAMEKRWKIVQSDPEVTARLHQSLRIHPAICQLLSNRSVNSFEEARNFFRPSLNDLHSPLLMKDMEKAVARILQAFGAREKILVFGDYDVVGTTSVASMYQFLANIYPPELLSFYIPHRYGEGYGVSKKGIEYAGANGFTLIIALDCGIKSVALITEALAQGIEFIVCDHHLPEKELPPAAAILNPKQSDCSYPFKDLCGCGVGLKLMQALCLKLGLPDTSWQQYLDLAATAVAADIVSMSGENRIIAYYGLKKVNEDPCPGIKALLDMAGVKPGKLQISNLVFVIAPRVNAAGRMDDARKAVMLFIEQDADKAAGYASMLHSDNSDRRDADFNITNEALLLIGNDEVHINRKSTVVFQPHWHKGVVGIVASRLIERYYRPTVVLTRSGEIVAGSARSVSGFNLYEAVHACREHLIGYGGHFAAAGMTLLPEQVENFSLKFEEVVAATITQELLTPELLIDAEISFRDLTPTFYNILVQMEPFGPDNARPVFISRNVKNNGWSRVLKNEHVRFNLIQENVTISGIGFGMADRFHILESGGALDIVYTLDENEWNGVKSLQVRVLDFRPSPAPQNAAG